MRFVRAAKFGLLLTLPLFGVGCANLSPKLSVLPSLARHRAESQYQTARLAEQRGQLPKARELYASLQRQSPNTSEYAHRMGVVCTQLQDYVTAGKYFEHARGIDPRNPALLADMGYCAYLQKDYASAEALLQESVQLAPGDSRAMSNLAMAIGFQGRYEDSLAIFRRVNSDTQAQLNVAFIQTQRNEPETAMATYRRVLSAEPGNKVATNALQQLNATFPRQLPVTQPAAENVASLSDTAQPPQVNVYPAWAQEIPKVTEATVARHEPDSLLRPMIASIDQPSHAAAFESPQIKPVDSRWAPSATAEPEAKVATTDTQFEPPKHPAPPSELAEDVQPAAIAAPVLPVDDMADVFEKGDKAPESPSSDMEELTGLEWAKDDLAREKAEIESGAKASPEPDDCLRGYCPVALRDERRLAAANRELTAEYQAQMYRFSSEEARNKFLAHPEKYVPAAGGLDIIEVRRGQAVAQGSLDFACWFRHRLHMFSSAENLTAFRAAPRDFVAAQ